MAFNVTALPEYVEQNKGELLTKAALGAETLDVIETVLNVKHKTALNQLETTAPFQSAKTCGFNASGDDKLSQRILEVFPIKVNKEYCDKDLLEKWTNQDLKIAAGRETLPFEQKFMEENNKAINANLDKLIWQGDADLSITGFKDVITKANGAVEVSLKAGSTMADLVDETYAAIPTAVLAYDPVIFMSYSDFRKYIQVLNSTCCANRPIVDANTSELKYMGDSRVTIKPVAGLEGVGKVYAGSRHNFVYGTDVEDSQNTYKFWFSDDDDVFRYKVVFTAGVQVAFPDELVVGSIAQA